MSTWQDVWREAWHERREQVRLEAKLQRRDRDQMPADEMSRLYRQLVAAARYRSDDDQPSGREAMEHLQEQLDEMADADEWLRERYDAIVPNPRPDGAVAFRVGV